MIHGSRWATLVREVMVPRVDMTAMEDTATIAGLRVMRQTGFSHPYLPHIDHRGIAHIKDLLEPALDQHAEREDRALRASCDYVPDTKKTSFRCSLKCEDSRDRWSSWLTVRRNR